jgi:hypothetical protein
MYKFGNRVHTNFWGDTTVVARLSDAEEEARDARRFVDSEPYVSPSAQEVFDRERRDDMKREARLDRDRE